MARGYYDKTRDAFGMQFRALYQQRGQRRFVRLPKTVVTKQAADAIAIEAENLCRVLETAPTVAAIARAIEICAITDDQAAALQGGSVAPLTGTPAARLTVEQAALAHPSSRREPLARQVEYCNYLKQFCAFASVQFIDDVTLEQVQRYIDHMRGRFTWSTRRHHLLYIRRACRMAGVQGLGDVLAGLRLDRCEQRKAVEVWSLDELVAGVRSLTESGKDDRALVVLALGGFMGLRPSEIWRAQVGDLAEVPAGLQLAVGVRAAKTANSVRVLPVPEILRSWLEGACSGRKKDAPLVPSMKYNGGRQMTISTANHLFHDTISTACGGRRLPLKNLRKSFATWAIRERCDIELVEAWIGHVSSRIQAVTQRHYLEAARAEQLLPLSKHLHRILAKRLPEVDIVIHDRRKARNKLARERAKAVAGRPAAFTKAVNA